MFLLTAILMTASACFSIDVTQSGMVDRPLPSTKFTYDALKDNGHRKSPAARIVREDINLRGNQRIKLQANANDIVRNFSIAAWAIRRHLDYVARFDFHARTGDRGLDRDIEKLIEIQSSPTKCDLGQRCSRERLFRLAESRRVIDGDTGLLLVSGGYLQGIESDLIRNPPKVDVDSSHEWVDGVEIDFAGAARRYAIHGRKKGSGYEWRKNVAAYNLILYGFFERYASEQVRGVSPITAALNPLRDVYENLNYALIKAKISQLFAIAMMRKEDAQSLDSLLPPAASESEEEDSDHCTEEPKPREINLSNGPTVFDLDPDEDIKVIESQTPSDQLQNFSRLVTMIALKALDIPYSFFDEGHTNYSGQRSCWLQYERSTLFARDDQKEMRRRWTLFQLQRFILEGWLSVPSGKSIGDLGFEWVPLGMPWWKPSEEIAGDLKAIAGGLDSAQRVVKERGRGDIFDNIDDLVEVMKYARDKGQEILGEDLRLNFEADFPPVINQIQSPA